MASLLVIYETNALITMKCVVTIKLPSAFFSQFIKLLRHSFTASGSPSIGVVKILDSHSLFLLASILSDGISINLESNLKGNLFFSCPNIK